MTTELQNEVSSQEAALQALIMDSDLERLEDLLAQFNLFDVLGIARREVRHSKFIAWLLDPHGSHGLRDYFLRSFLARVAAYARERGISDFTPFDVDGWKFRDVDVATERHDIDILIIDESDGFVCLIENKIGSIEHSSQLSNYLRTVEREYEGLTPLPIFLTPDGAEPEDEDAAERYVPVNYQVIADLIDRTLRTRGSTINSGVTNFLQQYVRTIERHVLDTTDNIDDLAYRIYNNHREAIDRIIAAKALPDTMTWDIVESAIPKFAPNLEDDFHVKSCRRFFSPYLDDIPELKEGKGWTKSGRMALFEFIYRGGQLIFYLMVGPGPQETRERLYRIAKYGGGLWDPPAKMKRHFHIYRRPILSQQDYNPFDRTKAIQKAGQAIQEFYEEDYLPLVDAVRAEFGSPQLHTQ